MPTNPARRADLLDAAIEILAAKGCRGLSFRTLDVQAGLPIGTSVNYFGRRDVLLVQVGERVVDRYREQNARVADELGAEHDRVAIAQLLTRLMLTDFRTIALATLELRVEATRHPALRKALTAKTLHHFDADVARTGMAPEDWRVVVVAFSGLIWSQLTLPDGLGITDTDPVVELLARRLLPPPST
ncbi:TetR/AcrR family transcriptional regulator [Saccharothrix stipae]